MKMPFIPMRDDVMMMRSRRMMVRMMVSSDNKDEVMNGQDLFLHVPIYLSKKKFAFGTINLSIYIS